MSNKNGDKVQGLEPPKIERNTKKVDAIVPNVVADPVAKDEIVIPRPNSNFSTTPTKEEQFTPEPLNPITTALDAYRIGIKEAVNEQEFADAQLGLYRFLVGVCDNSNHGEFRRDWTRVIKYFNSADDVGLVTLNKGVRYLKIDRGDQKAFSTLAFLIFARCKDKVGFHDGSISSIIKANALTESLVAIGNTGVQNILTYYNL